MVASLFENQRFQIPNSRFQIIPIPNSELQIPDSNLQNPDSKLQVSDTNLQIPNYSFPIPDSDYRFRSVKSQNSSVRCYFYRVLPFSVNQNRIRKQEKFALTKGKKLGVLFSNSH
jgi:hypothetical protein